MRNAFCCLLILIGTGAGCFSLPPSWPTNKPVMPPEPVRPVKPGPVTVEQVNEINARERANALGAEIDLDVSAEVTGMTPADAQAKHDELNKNK